MIGFHYRDFSNIDFGEQDLRWRSMYWYDLSGSDLSKCKIDHTTRFEHSIFDEKTKMPDYPLACPEKGEFIGWKKAFNNYVGSVIIELLIPEDAKRSSATGNKCRCSRAKVLSITPLIMTDKYIKKEVKEAESCHCEGFYYRLGEWVESIMPFDNCRWHECSSGIHFFMEKEDAINY